jgi:hypothetical protein
MNERDKELWNEAAKATKGAGDSWDAQVAFMQKFADLIRADERKRLEQAVEELTPVRDNPLLQNKPAAFWIESFKQIVRGDL